MTPRASPVRAFPLALLALSAEEEVSPRAARYGGFNGKLKMVSGRDRLIAGSLLAVPTLFLALALSNRRFRREDDDHGRQQDDGANVKQGWLHRRARPERRIDPGGAAPLRHSRQHLEKDGVSLMKPMPDVEPLLERAVKRSVFGTRER